MSRDHRVIDIDRSIADRVVRHDTASETVTGL
jgi:hypothetical protein